MKQLFENFRNYLEEGITDVVYHKTRLDLAADILEGNKFMTSIAFGTPADKQINKGKLYYLSTMRSPVGDYGPSLPAVTFKLDGRKLGERSKAAAVDYWGPDFPTNEMEDRVFTDEPWLEPASKYILEVHIGMRVKGQKYRPERLEELKKIVQISEKIGVPAYLYADEKTYAITNKTKRLTLDEWMALFEKHGDDLDEPWGYSSRPWSDDRLEGPAELIKAIEAGNLDDIDKGRDSFWYTLKYDYGGQFARQLSNTIHNNKAKPEARETISVIAQKMKELGTDNLQGLIDWMQGHVKAWVEEHENQKVAAEHKHRVMANRWRSFLKEEEIDWDTWGFSDEERGESVPTHPDLQTLMDLERGDKFTIGNRKPIFRVIGHKEKGKMQKPVVIDGTAERKFYIVKVVELPATVAAFEAINAAGDVGDTPRGKPGIVQPITTAELEEAIKLDIEVGDIVLGGKYKNKRMEVKEIGTDELGQPTINGKPILKFRIEKHLPDEKKSKKTLESEKDEK